MDMKYKFLLWDADDTLLDFKASERQAFCRTMRAFGVEPDEELCRIYHDYNKSLWKQFEQKRITREQIRLQRFVYLTGLLGLQDDPKALAERYVQELSEGFFTLPGAGQVLAALPDCEHYLLTNGVTEVQEKRLKGSGLAGYFREVFVSERAGAQKPDPRFFEYAFSQIPGFELGRALMIGDSLSADMAGARGVGLCCCWFNPEGKPAGDFRPDFEIRSLPEVLPLVLGE